MNRPVLIAQRNIGTCSWESEFYSVGNVGNSCLQLEPSEAAILGQRDRQSARVKETATV